MRAIPEIEHELEGRVETLGYELVEIRWGGSGRRPMLRLRIDKAGSEPGSGVTVDECAEVSRALKRGSTSTRGSPSSTCSRFPHREWTDRSCVRATSSGFVARGSPRRAGKPFSGARRD